MTVPANAGGRRARGPEISRKIFGGVLDYDGAGYYPGLELLNFVFGTDEDELLPTKDPVEFRRRAHDFGRRLVWDDGFQADPRRREVLYDEVTEEAVRHLLRCLQLPIPSGAKQPSWERAHFFPYTRSLIHWDARKRRDRIIIERRYLRGGGALAFRILRKDTDPERLRRCREGFKSLFPAGGESALAKLGNVFAQHGVSDEKPRPDDIEPESHVRDDGLEALYRTGTVNILEHRELSAVARIRALMNWTGLWLVLAQHSRASAFLSRPASVIICDCGAQQAQLRRASQRCLKDMQAVIVEAAEEGARAADAALSRAQRNKLRGFFWATAATIKLLNAWRGRRHFMLGLDVLETLVLAATEQESEQTFEEFVDAWLFVQCRLVVGRRAAEKAGLLGAIDASIFEDNENQLASQMRAAGLLTEYSDATRMVSTGGLT